MEGTTGEGAAGREREVQVREDRAHTVGEAHRLQLPGAPADQQGCVVPSLGVGEAVGGPVEEAVEEGGELLGRGLGLRL